MDVSSFMYITVHVCVYVRMTSNMCLHCIARKEHQAALITSSTWHQNVDAIATHGKTKTCLFGRANIARLLQPSMFIVALPPSPAIECEGDLGRHAALKCASDWSHVNWKDGVEFTTKRRRTLGNIATTSGTKWTQLAPSFVVGASLLPHLMSSCSSLDAVRIQHLHRFRSNFGLLSYGWRTWT